MNTKDVKNQNFYYKSNSFLRNIELDFVKELEAPGHTRSRTGIKISTAQKQVSNLKSISDNL